MTTAYIWHELFGWGDTGSGGLFPADPAAGLQPIGHHVAHADTKRRLHELVAVSGLIDHLQRIEPRHATEEEIFRVHTRDHVTRLRQESAQPKGGDAGDGISPFGKGGYEIAALAAGGAIELVEAVVTGQVDNGYALVHPCGHHAPAHTGMGFCMLNNVAIAVAHARAALGVRRVAVVDWDVHHGNGTQSVFWEEPDVLTLSVHQDGCFPPGSGHLTERGGPSAPGSAINIPMPPGTGDFGYLYAFERVVVPALRAFAPELIIVASGFDPNAMDPLARQLVTSRGFRGMTEQVLQVAAEVCDGRVAMVQEGGYSPIYVPFCGHAVIETLAGVKVLDDALFPVVGQMTGHDLAPHQKALVDEVAVLVLPA
ncbi:class II histone deacetylase [Streptomyces sp. NPDC001307]|uniref:class II histone deacetylase n=1 Tax=Streptomyces sp. NPDC001307 TaxID=3364560 RepID=UPI00368C6047